MSEDRRGANIELLLMEMGKLQVVTQATNKTVTELSVKVGIQNGRVGKLERWQSFLYGVSTLLTLLVIPLVIKYFPTFIFKIMGS